jgi:signal transduction histidine kinase
MKRTLFLIVSMIVLMLLSCKKGQSQRPSKEPLLPKRVDSLFNAAYNNDISIKTRKEAIKNIEDYLGQRANDSTKRKCYLRVASRYYVINDLKGEYNSVVKAYKLALKVKDTNIIARSCMYIGHNYLNRNMMDSAFYYNYKATTFYPITKDKNTQKRALSNLSLILKTVKDYDKSEQYAVEALKVVEKDSNYAAKYGVYNTLGRLFMQTNKLSLALDYHEKALKATEQFNNKQQSYRLRLKSQSLINIGVTMMLQGYHKEAEEYFKEADDINVLSKQYPINYAYLLENRAYNLHKLGKTDIMPLFKRALEVHDSINSKSRGNAELLLANYYKDINKIDSSFYFAKKAYLSSKEESELDQELKALHLMAQTDDTSKKPYWYETYLSTQDSVAKNNRQQQEKFALIAFNTENIKKEKQFAEDERDKANTRFWSALAISSLFAFALVMVYINRNRKLKNKELKLAQKELEANETIYSLMLDEQFKIEQGKHIEKKRISQELHDGVLGKLSGIRLNLFVLNKKRDNETVEKCLPYIKSLQEVEKEIRAISHNLSQDLFSDQVNFTKMVSGLFENIAGHSNLKLKLYFDELIDWKTVSNTTKIEVYRMLQEGFHNIQKHAKANNVVVRMVQNETDIIVELIDDGIGMSSSNISNGIGLKNMKERADKINAKLTIESQSNKGTVLSVAIPKAF